MEFQGKKFIQEADPLKSSEKSHAHRSTNRNMGWQWQGGLFLFG